MKDDDIKRREEQKREAAYDPLDRWRHTQETIGEPKPIFPRRNVETARASQPGSQP